MPKASIALPVGSRGWGLAAALLVALAVPLAAGGTPLWWFGGALLFAGVSLGAHVYRAELERAATRLRQPRQVLGVRLVPGALLLELLCTGVVAAIATVMMGDVLGGERPVSHDHTVHYVRAWLFHEELLPHGRLFGWSNSWFAGHPIGYLYPVGADLWVNAVHALGFGALRFSQSYALAFWLFHVFTGLAVYRLGRIVGGRAVGVLAGVLCLTDLAYFRMGGWSYTVEYGVWPQALSLNFGLLALCHLPAMVETRKLAPIGAFGVWMGLAIITHPIQLVFLGPLVLASALAAGFADGVRAPAAMLRLGLACALSLVVSAAWLIPFLTSRAETNSMGVWWDTTYEMAKGLLGLRFFAGTLGYVIAFGVLGLLVLLRTRRFAPLFVALTALCIPAVSNSSFIDELHLTAIAPALSKVQFIRLSTMAKPFWFVLAAYFAVAAVANARRLAAPAEGASEEATGEGSPLRAAIIGAAVAALALPVLVPAAEAFWTQHVRKSITTESDRPLLADRVRLEHWLARELPRDGFYRVGVFTGHNHDLMDLAPLIKRPIFKRGFTPASNFIYQMDENNPATLEAINLRFAISKVYLSSDDFETVADLGRYRVYRFKRWQPNPFLVEGTGRVALERFEDERIVLHADPGATGKLRVNVSYFSRWHAYRDGKPIPIAVTYLREAPDKTGFMTVKLAPGRYEFVFEPSLGDRLALPIGLCGLVLCFALIAADRRPLVPAMLARGAAAVFAGLDAFSEPRFRRLRLTLLWLGAVALTATGVALARWTPPLQPQPGDLGPIAIERVRFDFLERVSRAFAAIRYRAGRQLCLRQGDRLVCRDPLGNLDSENYVASSPATLKDYILVRCVRARPVDDGVLEVTYPRVPAGDAIVGYYGIERAGRLMFKRRPVEIAVHVGGKVAYQGKTQTDNQIHWFKADLPVPRGARADVTFSVRADNVSKRYFCFNAQMVDLRRR